ncbi:class I SAM-dependent methyltransferase [Demequina mangrovi]|uniref:Methyltransferase domain-containing protein n=1 Tax=Demequina mangrovi TaxID=1043493 RepID=A0A1H6YBM1_9MICO|nr:class I SAM-dependent methyltransferase [Demequina mangrovi]SEJ34602.1 Methyltransferase domain-containing protein [Demequina mangrovi]
MNERSLSFGKAASDYAKGRPGYPLQMVDWLLEGVTGRVLDLGAGTGKLTEAIHRCRHAEVVAVDPDPVMLATLEAHVPRVPTMRGTAEEIPLEDGSVDAVVMGQAWHWVDPEAAATEIARVLAPGGVLGLVWNIRNERSDWVTALTRVIGHSSAETMLAAGPPRVPAPFGPLEIEELTWKRPITADGLRALVHSRSNYITAPEAFRVDLDVALEHLIARTPELAGGGEFPMPYVTHGYRTRVAPAA